MTVGKLNISGNGICSEHGEHVTDVSGYGSSKDRENAQRLADCWNACEGMESPATEIALLREGNNDKLKG